MQDADRNWSLSSEFYKTIFFNLVLAISVVFLSAEVAQPNPRILLGGARPRRYGSSEFLGLSHKQSRKRHTLYFRSPANSRSNGAPSCGFKLNLRIECLMLRF